MEKPGLQAAAVIGLCLLLHCTLVIASSSTYFSEVAPSTLSWGRRWPNVDETEACRPIRDRIRSSSPRFRAELVTNRNIRVRYKCTECRYMSSRCDTHLNAVVDLVRQRWGYSRTTEVQLAWTQAEIPGQNQSLHYEGRSLQLRLIGGSNYDHTVLAGLCIRAGFDWVRNNGQTVQASAIPTSCNTPLDLAFALDASGSVGEYNFETQLTFINNMIEFFDIAESDTRVSIVRFATNVNRQFSFTRYTSRSSLKTAVSRIDYTGGYTAIGPALNVAERFMFTTSYGARPVSDGVPRVLVLMTDGKANVGVKPATPADSLKAGGVNIFVIGVGNSLDVDELEEVASRPVRDYLYRLARFDDYAALVNRMRSISCDEPADVPPGQNTTTDVPEDGYKYFKAKCAGLSGNVIISVKNIVGNTHVFASTTVRNPNPWYDPRLVVRDMSTNQIKSVLVKLPDSNDETVYIAIKGTDKINKFTIVISDDLFGAEEFQVSFDEEEPAGSPITTLLARSREGFTVEYSLPSGSADVAIDRMSGQITSLRPFDRELEASISVTVLATDPNLPCYSGRANLIVNILDINDNPPVFKPANYRATINDSSPVGFTVLTVTATDRDIGRNGQLSFSLSGVGAGDFTIDDDGVVRVASSQLSLDRMAVYALTATATDNGQTRMRGEASVTIAIRRTNQAPRFLMECARQAQLCRFVVPENSNVRLNFTAVDNDEGANGMLSYALDPISSPNLFSVDSNGFVTNSEVLDFEQADFHEFSVTVRDAGNPYLSSTVQVAVTVENVNEFSPQIAPCVGSVLENVLNSTVLTVIATDPDPFGGLVYVLVEPTQSGVFHLARESGVLSTRQPLDREQIDFFSVPVLVRDSGNPSRDMISVCNVSVDDINDNTPRILNGPFDVEVNESVAIGTALVQVVASDADLGLNAEITYTLTADSGSRDQFAVNATTGIVSTARQLDREMENRHMLSILVRDNGVPSLANETTVTITVLDVNDNRCLFLGAPYTASVPERSGSGVILAQVAAADIDLGDNAVVRYRITAQNLFVNIFGIDEVTGVVSTTGQVPSLDPGTGPDFGQGGQQTYVVPIEGFDLGVPSLTCQTTLTVHVTDVRERGIMVNRTLQEVMVPENSPIGTPIAEFVPTEAREFVAPLTYRIVGGNQDGLFMVNSSSGVVAVKAMLDRESALGNEFQLFITIRDSSSPALSITVSLFVTIADVNDHPPQFSLPEYSGSVTENQAAGQPVARVSAIDLDAGVNAHISFSFFHSESAERFYIENTTGIVRNRISLDRENVSFYVLKVIARDHGIPSLSSTSLVQVTVFDANDNPPTFFDLPASISVSEDVTVPVELLTASARDPDQGKNGELVFSLSPIADAGFFSIDRPSGRLTLERSLDRDVRDVYEIEIVVSDEGTPPLTSTHSLSIAVVDANDNRPEFVGTPYTASVKENHDETMVVLTVVAEDPDIGANGDVRYSLPPSPTNPYVPFTIHPVLGHLLTTSNLDYENETQYALTVLACDQGIPQHCTETGIAVAILNVNEFRPTFTNRPFFPRVEENALPGTTILTLVATDGDRDDTLHFAIISGNDNGIFSINGTTGAIKVNAPLDFETRESYELITMVEDSGNLSSIAVVSVTIVDVNDNAPVFSANVGADPVVTISDATKQVILTVTAADRDSGSNGAVHYNIRGVVTVNLTTSIVTVEAFDSGSPRQTTNVNITVITQFECDVVKFFINFESGLVTVKTLCEVVFDVYEPTNLTHGALVRGDNVTFICVARSNCHESVEYRLFKDGSTDGETSVGGATYWAMTDVVLADEGWYSCQALLPEVGALHSHQVALDITEAPTITGHPETVNVETGSPANFTCVVRADPKATIRWQRNGQDIPLDSDVFAGANTTTLSIENVTLFDYGQLRCVASNRLGVAKSRNAQIFSYVESDQITFVARVRASRTAACPQFSLQQFQYAIKQSLNLDTVATAIRTGDKCNDDPCWPQPCENRGVCSARGSGFSCSCPSGWIGSKCEVDRDECVRNPCKNSGTCVNMEGTFRCNCPNDTTGQRCQLNPAACLNANCRNDSMCYLTAIRQSGHACVRDSDRITVALKLKAGRTPAAADVAEQLTPAVLNSLLKKAKDKGSKSSQTQYSSRRRRQADDTSDDSFDQCEIIVLGLPQMSQDVDQTFATQFIVLCPDDQDAPPPDLLQSVCQDLTDTDDITQCSVGNQSFVKADNDTETSVQLQLLILSNGSTIPVTAEEGVRLLTGSGIQALLVPFGFSVVRFQAGLPTVSPTTVTTPGNRPSTQPDSSAVVSDSNDWLIVGVAIAGVMFVVVVFCIWLTCFLKRRDGGDGDSAYNGVTFKRGSEISAPMTGKQQLSAVDTLKSRSVSNLNMSSSTIFSNEAAFSAECYDASDSMSSRQSRSTAKTTVMLAPHEMDSVDLDRLHSSTAGFMVTMPNLSHITSGPYATSPLDQSPTKQHKASTSTTATTCPDDEVPRYVPKPTTFAPPTTFSFAVKELASDDSDLERYEPMSATPVGYRSHRADGSSAATATLPMPNAGAAKQKEAARMGSGKVAASTLPGAVAIVKAPVTDKRSATTLDSLQSEGVEALLAELNATLKQGHDSGRRGADESPCHRGEMHARIVSDYFYDALGYDEEDYEYDTLHGGQERRGSGLPPPPLPPRNEALESGSKSLPRPARLANLQKKDGRNQTLDRVGSRDKLMGSDSEEDFRAMSTGSVNYMTPI